ncbi:hypothetical protein PSYMP_28628 [Pseudomonas amygdali pv. morsprunorum str. M302280]|nr:hypothetical protein PSYMP_28628 [Pseudomonas amygdali pv. morsprunorum str. M302280]
MLVVTFIVKFDFLVECGHVSSRRFFSLFFFCYLLPEPHFFGGRFLHEFY